MSLARTPQPKAELVKQQLEAAHTIPGHTTSPIEAFIDNTLEQLLKDFEGELSIEAFELVRIAYVRGLQDGKLSVGELL